MTGRPVAEEAMPCAEIGAYSVVACGETYLAGACELRGTGASLAEHRCRVDRSVNGRLANHIRRIGSASVDHRVACRVGSSVERNFSERSGAANEEHQGEASHIGTVRPAVAVCK